MFTGIIEEIGFMKSVKSGARSATFEIAASRVLADTQPGDSIAVNGVCLTVTSLGKASFMADAMPETLKSSNLGELHSGSPVNLERALRLGDRLGGHIVSGHIDGTGSILNVKEDENAIWICITAGADLLRYIVHKGSVAVDGVSLTVVNVQEDRFYVSVIPYTRKETILCDKTPGSKVNLECDVVAKYIERFAGFGKQMVSDTKKDISIGFLEENGYF